MGKDAAKALAEIPSAVQAWGSLPAVPKKYFMLGSSENGNEFI